MGKKEIGYKYSKEDILKAARESLHRRGVEIEDIASIVFELQKPFREDVTLNMCIDHVLAVLNKREVCFAILTGIALDELAERDLIDEPLRSIIQNDEGLYGVDEILPLSVVNIYGSIGLTNFGYLDKVKIGIIRELDEEKEEHIVNTFLDDLVAAIAAAAASRLAHS